MIVKMSRLRLVGLKEDYNGVIDILTKSKQFEYRSAHDPVCAEADDGKTRSEQAEIGFAIDYLIKLNGEAAALKKKKVPIDYSPFKLDGVRKVIDFDNFNIAEQKKEELSGVIDSIKNITYKQAEIKAEIIKLKEQENSISVFEGLPFAFSAARETEYTCSTLYFTARKTRSVDIENAIVNTYAVKGGMVMAVTCMKSDFDKVNSSAVALGYTPVKLHNDKTAEEIASGYRGRAEELKGELDELMMSALSFEPYLADLMIYYDLLTIKQQQKTAYDGFELTHYTFVLDGWVPADSGEKIVKEIEGKYDIIYSLTPAKKEEEPPTMVVNNGLVAPFENITKMYTVPAYTELDPNPHMAIWYFVLFGVMCGDVVYGLMLTLGCLLLLKIKKFERGTASLIKMFAICGVSSALWGVAFDSYLGYSVGFGWFIPMDKPMLLLGLSLALGILQISYGYILGIIRCIRDRDAMGAIFDMGLMLVVIAAIILLTANIFTGIFTLGVFNMSGSYLPPSLSAAFSKAGLIMLLVAIVGIFLTYGRSSKSIVGKLGNGLYGVYGLVNLISDILSYCRLFGLGLAGGAIAYAFNTLMGTIFFGGGSVVGFIIGALLTLVLHIFNLAISLLGAYVHNARLQMLEFYGKFLIGDGREFSYVGQNTKYVRY